MNGTILSKKIFLTLSFSRYIISLLIYLFRLIDYLVDIIHIYRYFIFFENSECVDLISNVLYKQNIKGNINFTF